jgi:N-acetylneuraminic acid mutarotase
MSKISYPQLVKDVADAVRIATKTTSLIPAGDLAEIIASLGTQVGDDGFWYKSITYNEDDTITLIDNNEVAHTLVCKYTEGKITDIRYDGVRIDLGYDTDKLINVGGTDIDLGEAPTKLNIAFGDTPPTNTSMLWVKSQEPDSITVGGEYWPATECIHDVDAYFPNSRKYFGCTLTEGRNVYLIGGSNDAGMLSSIAMFDTETERMHSVSVDMPIPITSADCVCVSYMENRTKYDKLYIFNGSTKGQSLINSLYMWDSKDNEITKLQIDNATFWKGACYVPVGSLIYIFGGKSLGLVPYRYNTVYVLNTTNNTVTELSTTLPQSRSDMSGVRVDNKIYLFGGSTTSGNVSTAYIFDIEKQEFEPVKNSVPHSFNPMGCMNIGNDIYLFGGANGALGSDKIVKFNIDSQNFTTLDIKLLAKSTKIVCVKLRDTIYLFDTSATYPRVCKFQYGTIMPHLHMVIYPALIDGNEYYSFNVINEDSTKIYATVSNILMGDKNNIAKHQTAYLYNDENGGWTNLEDSLDVVPQEVISNE